MRDPAKLVVDEWQDCVEGVLVAFLPVPQQFGKRLGNRIRQVKTPRPGLQSSSDTLHPKPIQINVLEPFDTICAKSFRLGELIYLSLSLLLNRRLNQ